MNRIAEANYFIDLAVEKVKTMVQSGFAAPEILDMMLDQKMAIEKLSIQKKCNPLTKAQRDASHS